MKPAISAKKMFKSLNKEEFLVWLEERGEKKYRMDQVLQWVYKKRVKTFDEMLNVSQKLRQELTEAFDLDGLETVRCLGAKDTTRKYLFRLRDGNLIESVLIPASQSFDGEQADRMTLCVSSQVGCAYGCKFCASGLDGWLRNLEAGEIVDQIMRVERESGEVVNNIVFMGMGEPLANFDNLQRAIEVINAFWGLEIGARHITVSTSGLVPQIRLLAEQSLQVRLAISLHGMTNEVRSQIMPVNRKYPIEELFDACHYFLSKKKQKITFEYILIKGVNDTLEQAELLVKQIRPLNAKINVIPYNTVEGLSWERPSVGQQNRFMDVLKQGGLVATLRREKGHDINAACGQLRRQTQRVT